jgi:hypothetical protein
MHSAVEDDADDMTLVTDAATMKAACIELDV